MYVTLYQINELISKYINVNWIELHCQIILNCIEFNYIIFTYMKFTLIYVFYLLLGPGRSVGPNEKNPDALTEVELELFKNMFTLQH